MKPRSYKIMGGDIAGKGKRLSLQETDIESGKSRTLLQVDFFYELAGLPSRVQRQWIMDLVRDQLIPVDTSRQGVIRGPL